MSEQHVLDARDVSVTYGTGRKNQFQALHEVSLSIREGETVGLVGESGSGKTTFGRAVLGLVSTSSGSLHFQGRDITNLPRSSRRALAKDIQVVFQDPYSSLNPAFPVGEIIAEPLIAGGLRNTDARARVRQLLDRVHLPAAAIDRYPREFSGGQRQRIAIARSLALTPSLVICDEPVSALDLSTQRAILDLLVEIQKDTKVAYLFVSHDLSVVRHISHRVAVMRKGQIVEFGPGEVITREPTHPYSRALLLSAPIADPIRQGQRRRERLEAVARGELSADPLNSRSQDDHGNEAPGAAQ